MNKYLLLSLAFVCVSTATLVGQNKFRVQEWNGVGEFIVPPKSKLVNGDGELRDCARFHRMLINGLTSNFQISREAINNFNTKHSSNKFKSAKPLGLPFCTKILNGGFVQLSIYETDETNAFFSLVVELDYSFLPLLVGNHELESYFVSEVGINLITVLSGFETGDRQIFAPGISRLIWQKLFESIPVPVEAQLGEYLAITNSNKSFILLDEKIQLEVDLSVRENDLSYLSVDTTYYENSDSFRVSRVKLETNYFWYKWLGKSYLNFEYDRSGLIVQNHFTQNHNYDVSNEFDPDTILIASGVDFQNSSILKKRPYLVLLHEANKRNTNNRNISSRGGYSSRADDDREIGGSYLFHFSSEDILNGAFHVENGMLALEGRSGYKRSFFGNRNSIVPVINIFVNGIQDRVQLLTRLDGLQYLPQKYTLRRLFKGKYRKVKGDRNLIRLKYCDQIKFKA